MIRNLLLLILSIIVLNLNLSGQSGSDYSSAMEQLKSRGEVYFQFHLNQKDALKDLSRIISIDQVIPGEVYTIKAYASLNEFAAFLNEGFAYEVLPAPGINPEAITSDWRQNKSAQAWDTYPTYPAYVAMMQSFETTYPGLCELHSIGLTGNGREILYLKITNHSNDTFPKPRFNYTSSMHGDETTGYILMLRLIDYLLSNYGTNPSITQLVDNQEIWINPLANPDGTYYGGDNSVANAVRYNSQNIDFNRNFPDYDDGQHPDNLPWSIETLVFMNFADSLHFTMGANFHGGAEVVNYPWDTQVGLHPDDAWWVFISREYADTVHANSTGLNYLTFLDDGITNGYAWYEVAGGRQDYMNYYNRCREMTIELSNIKNPAASTLPDYWNYNYKSLLNTIKQANYGLRGIVTDSLTGAPLIASAFIQGHDEFNTDVMSEMPYGAYFRLINAGSYQVTFSAPGYQSKTIAVSISNYQATQLDVQLSLALPTVDFAPLKLTSCDGLIEFENNSSSNVGSTVLWDFGDGNSSTEWAPNHQYTQNGNFQVILSITNSVGTSSLSYPDLIQITMPDQPSVVTSGICTGNTALLMSNFPDTYWYSDALGINQIYQGDSLETSILSNDTTFYVQRKIQAPSQYTGKPDNSGTGNYFTNSQIHYLVFDCYEECVLKTVVLYTNSAGSRTITLRDEAGNILQSATVQVVNGGPQTVSLNFNLPVASNLRLAGPANPGFYRNNDAAAVLYPYEIGGLISVKSSSAGTSPLTYYYYFYNWEIESAACKTAIQAITVPVSQTAPAMEYAYTQSNDTVWFTNLSTGNDGFTWDFGDGNYDNLQESPFHVYSQSGSYTVVLSGGNPCGTNSFSTSIDVTIGVEEISAKPGIRLYPNPANDFIRISMPESFVTARGFITIYDGFGKVLYRSSMEASSQTRNIEINTTNLPSGIYRLSLSNQKEEISSGFVLIR